MNKEQHKRLFKTDHKNFKKFLISKGLWMKFKSHFFLLYGRLSHEEVCAEDSIQPPEFISGFPKLSLIEKPKWLSEVNVQWQTFYYKLEDKA